MKKLLLILVLGLLLSGNVYANDNKQIFFIDEEEVVNSYEARRREN